MALRLLAWSVLSLCCWVGCATSDTELPETGSSTQRSTWNSGPSYPTSTAASGSARNYPSQQPTPPSAPCVPDPVPSAPSPTPTSRTGAAGSGSTVAPPRTAADTNCSDTYTVATHIVIDVAWSGSLALTKGQGQVHLWSKSTFVPSATGATVTSQSCGSALPVIRVSAFAGGYQVLPEIPDAAWDDPAMPTFTGSAVRQGDDWIVTPGVALVGLTLSDPTEPWPEADEISGLDQDGDGALGITALPRVGGAFEAPPVNLAQSARADALYLAIRNVMTLTSTSVGCPQTMSGSAEISHFDNHIIGCRVDTGRACTASERDFVDDNRTVYELHGGSFTSRRIAETASCAEVRSLLPGQ